MDPVVALLNADHAISDCDMATARENLTAYYQWRSRGGFQPLSGHGRIPYDGDDFATKIEWRLATLDYQRYSRVTLYRVYEVGVPIVEFLSADKTTARNLVIVLGHSPDAIQSLRGGRWLWI